MISRDEAIKRVLALPPIGGDDTVTRIAIDAGISRPTLYKWVREHQAALVLAGPTKENAPAPDTSLGASHIAD